MTTDGLHEHDDDRTLTERVRAELAALAGAGDDVAVEVARHIATLRGCIADPQRAQELANAAIGVEGIDFVQNLVETRPR